MFNETPFETLVGKTLTAVDGAVAGSEEILLTTADGERFRLSHDQDCCESVSVEDVSGDVADLIGSPITLAEVSTSGENPPDAKPETVKYQESFTWTFYRLATAKGFVVVRWYGESNGYYGEEVDFKRVD